MPAPNQQERQQCWNAKDSFWKCMDASSDDKSMCQALRHKFEESCSKQWVKYFDRRREYLKFKSKLEKEVDPVVNLQK